MSITRRTDYAVRIMYELAQLPHGASLSLRDVCSLADIPESFGATIATFLAEAALVSASGYNNKLLSLARPAEQINMAEIIYACEPEFSLSECARNPDVCDRSIRCGVQTMWEELDAIVVDHLTSVTLARVARGTRSNGLTMSYREQGPASDRRPVDRREGQALTDRIVLPSAATSTSTGSSPSAMNAKR